MVDDINYGMEISILNHLIKELKHQKELKKQEEIKSQSKINIIAFYTTEEEAKHLIEYIRDKMEVYPYYVGSYKKTANIEHDIITATNEHAPEFIWEDE